VWSFRSQVDNDLDFGTRDYEWSDDQYNPVTEVETEVTELRQRLRSAIVARDFIKAKELKNAIDQRNEAASRLRHMEYHLRQAVERQDYDRAFEINEKISQIHNKADQAAPAPSMVDILNASAKRAMGSGLAGATAMVVQGQLLHV
jgi:hypothetical protein